MTWSHFSPRCFNSESYPVICDSEFEFSVGKVPLALTGFHAHLLTRLKTNQPRETLETVICDTVPVLTLQTLDFVLWDSAKWSLSGPYDWLMSELLVYWRKTSQKAAQRVWMRRGGRSVYLRGFTRIKNLSLLHRRIYLYLKSESHV